ncbi:MAG: hypothetical protein LLG45_00255 [Actinomycetia bacterium]|nr:hypothetical protein [Actinomycetes bacterium]
MAEKPWADLTPDENLARRIDRWRTSDLPFASPEAEADYNARVDRLTTAIRLGKPDRVPIRLMLGVWPAVRAGMTAAVSRMRGALRARER